MLTNPLLLEDLLESANKLAGKRFWKQQTGVSSYICEMADSHLMNTIRMLRRANRVSASVRHFAKAVILTHTQLSEIEKAPFQEYAHQYAISAIDALMINAYSRKLITEDEFFASPFDDPKIQKLIDYRRFSERAMDTMITEEVSLLGFIRSSKTASLAQKIQLFQSQELIPSLPNFESFKALLALSPSPSALITQALRKDPANFKFGAKELRQLEQDGVFWQTDTNLSQVLRSPQSRKSSQFLRKYVDTPEASTELHARMLLNALHANLRSSKPKSSLQCKHYFNTESFQRLTEILISRDHQYKEIAALNKITNNFALLHHCAEVGIQLHTALELSQSACLSGFEELVTSEEAARAYLSPSKRISSRRI